MIGGPVSKGLNFISHSGRQTAARGPDAPPAEFLPPQANAATAGKLINRTSQRAAWLGCAAVLAGLALGGPARASTASTPIQHVVIIMQENRTFDSYFGTYPGADGIPNGVCQPILFSNPSLGCIAPFHDVHDQNTGGPHGDGSSQGSLDDGITTMKIDGFVNETSLQFISYCKKHPSSACKGTNEIAATRHDAVGYHTSDELPNYWSYAQHFVLQDHMFSGVRSWSGPNHYELASAWSAICTSPTDATTCITWDDNFPTPTHHAPRQYPWASLFQLLDVHNVSWKYYLGTGSEPDCEDDSMDCPPIAQIGGVSGWFNPAPGFNWVRAQGAAYLAAHNPDVDQFLIDVRNGTLPQVSWIVPSNQYSEHPPASITEGMEYVTSLVNAVMQSPYWNSTVIFISWDDYGGFYDHETPPNIDVNSYSYPVQGFGIRVPGLAISPWVKAGLIDHQILSVDSYAQFFEDLFMNGDRLNPSALGNPDSRPVLRDSLTTVTYWNGTTAPMGRLINEFDFTQSPQPPLLLSTAIPSNLVATCRKPPEQIGYTCTLKSVALQWKAVPLSGNFTYHITRDGVELPQCAGTALACTDTPPPGNHFYRAFTIDAAGVVSPNSAAAETDMK